MSTIMARFMSRVIKAASRSPYSLSHGRFFLPSDHSSSTSFFIRTYAHYPVGSTDYKGEDERIVMPRYKIYPEDINKIIDPQLVNMALAEEEQIEARLVQDWLERIKVDTKTYSVVAVPTAEKYNMRRLKEALHKQGLYIPCEIGSHTKSRTIGGSESIHAIAKYNINNEYRHIYFFKDGCVVFWNCSKEERSSIIQHLESFEYNRHETTLILRETDTMKYAYNSSVRTSYIKNGVMYIAAGHSNLEDICLDRYTFSNALAQSVTLGLMESKSEGYVNYLEILTTDLKTGTPIRASRNEILKITGKLYALKHTINLATDLLDIPDFYWDKDNKEQLFTKSCNYFSINRRTKALNEKLSHCTELIELVRNHLGDKHHIHLEWMIIILIMVEVFFELLHWADRLGYKLSDLLSIL